MPRLTLKKVNEAIQAKWPGVELARNGNKRYQYYYVTATEKNNYGMGIKVSKLYQTIISGVSRLDQLPLEQWIESVEFVLLDKHKRPESSRNPAI